MVKVFGIRHHGPGSAQRLLEALTDFRPDCVLIEAPADADPALEHLRKGGFIPPVALLMYNPKNLQQATYLPFARFSPEWQAIFYAFETAIPVQCIDLPMALTFTLEQDPQYRKTYTSRPITQLQKDPLGYMAKLAGYEDSERWWEATFEHYETDTAIFDAILELVRPLRKETAETEGKMTLIREAFMRKCIRQRARKGFDRIAVVCGAWHAPALQDVALIKSTADNSILKGIKKTPTKTSWIPWSYDRLAFKSGYGAGVISPAWYDLLFEGRASVTQKWMVQVAQLLREVDFDNSPAHSTEAVRLANALAALRQKPLPGIEELQEAAITIFGNGQREKLSMIAEKLVVGTKIGFVPKNIPRIPLQEDLDLQVKRARLGKAQNTTETIQKKLDLRKPANLLASLLLHRLLILDIPWGRTLEKSEFDTGSFSELWELQWQPDFLIQLIELGMLGNTIEEAAIQKLLQAAEQPMSLLKMTTLVGKALNAQLEAATPPILQKLQQQAAITQDVDHLMDALPELVNIRRYGDTRNTETQAIAGLLDQLIPRICIGLPTAALQLDNSLAEELFEKIIETNKALNLLNQPEHQKSWEQSLSRLAYRPNVPSLLSGGSIRLLFDKKAIDLSTTEKAFRLALSINNPPAEIAYWVEGFLVGSGLLLIHNPSLWFLLDNWLNKLEDDPFNEVLPLLRRTFAKFTSPERKKMLQAANNPQDIKSLSPQLSLKPSSRVQIASKLTKQVFHPTQNSKEI